jgi:TrmH family RNA methyltransferase
VIKKKIKISVVPYSIFKKLSDTKTPSGLLATCKINLLKQKKYNSSRWLFLYKIKDPGNLGTILRSAAWFNIKNIALSKDCTDTFNNKVVRSAMGAHIYLNIYKGVQVDEFVKNNYLIVGADQNANNTVEQIDLSKKIVLCLGGESEGFDNQIIKKINKLISIKKNWSW